MNPCEDWVHLSGSGGNKVIPTKDLDTDSQRDLFGQPSPLSPDASADEVDQIVMMRTDSLKPHPSMAKLKTMPPIARLQQLEKLPEVTFKDPLEITRDCVIIDGHARWLSARHLKRTTLPCIIRDLTEQEALQRILRTHRHTQWLNRFCRTQLALELKAWYRDRAQANQSAGGKGKGQSKLTQDKRFDCRRQIASDADVSTGNVTKVEQILSCGRAPELLLALRDGTISVHAAWKLRNLSISDQKSALKNAWSKKRMQQRLRRILLSSAPKSNDSAIHLRQILKGYRGLTTTSEMSAIWEQLDYAITAIENLMAPGGLNA